MSEAFSEIFEREKGNLQTKQGSLIEARVAQITDSVVIVDAGLKSEGVIAIEEFRNKDNDLEVDVGDTVEVMLEMLEDGFGKTHMSRSQARQVKTWKRLEEAHKEGHVITGVMITRVKGGFTVDIDGVIAFLPGSLVDVKLTRDSNYSYLENKEIEVKVLKLDYQRNNIVVSRKAVLETKYGIDHEEMEKNIQEGAVVKGFVKHLTDYGAFIGVNGTDGLLHITDMAWKRVKSPSDLLSVGDEIEVKILKYDREKRRMSLGLKQMTDDPWVELVERYPVGSRAIGRVTSLTDYGCFVEIEEGIEGLVHVSEMDWISKNTTPSKVVSTDDKVEVMVIGIDKPKRRISLGFKQCTPNPWEEFMERHPKGSKFKGMVKSINDFGIFIGTPHSEIDGLVHINDISAMEPSDKAILKYKKGDEVEVSVLSTDVKKERIALSIKALQDDFLKDFTDENPKGTAINNTVVQLTENDVVVQLTDKVRGIIDIAEFRSTEGKLSIAEGDEIEAKVVGIDRKNLAIKLSIKEREREDRQQAVEDYKVKTPHASSSLGNFFQGINPFKKK